MASTHPAEDRAGVQSGPVSTRGQSSTDQGWGVGLYQQLQKCWDHRVLGDPEGQEVTSGWRPSLKLRSLVFYSLKPTFA